MNAHPDANERLGKIERDLHLLKWMLVALGILQIANFWLTMNIISLLPH